VPDPFSIYGANQSGTVRTVPKSDKLLKFTLNDGTGEDRVILSGIHHYYEPEELIGKTAICRKLHLASFLGVY